MRRINLYDEVKVLKEQKVPSIGTIKVGTCGVVVEETLKNNQRILLVELDNKIYGDGVVVGFLETELESL